MSYRHCYMKFVWRPPPTCIHMPTFAESVCCTFVLFATTHTRRQTAIFFLLLYFVPFSVGQQKAHRIVIETQLCVQSFEKNEAITEQKGKLKKIRLERDTSLLFVTWNGYFFRNRHWSLVHKNIIKVKKTTMTAR